jgi:acyl dehydratase
VTALRDATVGQELPPLVIESIDPEKMKLMAAILRDPNPIHIDVESVRALGLGERTVNQGPSNLSYLLGMVSRWSGGQRTLRSVAVRFLGNVFAGDRLECRGRVEAIDADTGQLTLAVEAVVGERTVLQGTVLVGARAG